MGYCWQPHVNGDGSRDQEDSFGLVAFSYPYRWAESFGIEAYQKTSNSSELTLDINNERVMLLVDKLHNWFFAGSNDTWVDFGTAKDKGRDIFSAGRSLFLLDTTGGYAPIIVDTDIDFGVVPYPKLDEQQDDYYSGCGDGLVTVPITAKDAERTGIIVEAMAYEGYSKIIPAYIESTLKARYASDEECSRMMGLIFEKQVLSWSYLFANAVPNGMQYTLIGSTVPNNNFASWYAQNEAKEIAFMESLEAFYAD